jgi:hypothetical protein
LHDPWVRPYNIHMKQIMFVPFVVVFIGVGWLLNSFDLSPDVNWLWPVPLVGSGLLWLILRGFNKSTLLLAPLLILGGLLEMLRQLHSVPLKVELPILVVAFGLFWLLSEHKKIAE